MNLKFLITLSVISFSFTGFSVSGQTTLPDLLKYSLAHSRDVRKAVLQVQEADYKHKEAVANGFPQITGSASYSLMMFKKFDIPASLYSMVPSQYAPMLDELGNINKVYMASAGAQVSQLIYSQSYLVGLKASAKASELYEILKTKSEEDLIDDVANGYYTAGSLMLQLETIKKSLQNLTETYRIVELNYKNDMVKETSVNRLKVTITNLEVTRQTIENGIKSQVNYLKALAGMPGDSAISIDTASFIHDFKATSFAGNFKVEEVPSFQALLKQSEIYKEQVRLSKAEYYPTLAAYGKFSYASYNIKSSLDTWTPMTTVGLSLSVPIFSSGVNRAKVKQSLIKQTELDEDISQTKDLLKVQYDNSVADYQSAQKLLEVQKENRELAQKVYHQTSLQYQEGMASLADLLNVNSDFLQADNSFNQQILNCKTSEIKMLKASGNLKSLINQK
jgi:outer membrane protein TolC